MSVIITKIDPNSHEFKLNYIHMQNLVKDLHVKINNLLKISPHKITKYLSQHKNKLLPRDRIKYLLDPNPKFPFLELSQLAAYDMYANEVASAGIITGIGFIHQQACMIIANDATIKSGAYYPMTIKKHLRAQQIALENRLPCIYLVDSAGAYLALQDEVFPDKDNFGRIFFNQAQMSAQNIPQIAAVMGYCTAGGAYIPAMSDECIMVDQQATIFLAGPPLVKAAIGESIAAEELGGAHLHCKISGVADYLAINEQHALTMIREIVANFNLQAIMVNTSNHHDYPSTAQFFPGNAQPEIVPPVYPITDLYGLISTDPRILVDMREIIARIIDGSIFQEFKALYGKTIVCGFAKVMGYHVGIIGNNGVLFNEAANKAVHFIEICCKRKIPLLFLQNITGFMVGSNAEMTGIAKSGAKMVMAVANAKVPKMTIIVGNSIGAGNYSMCGRAYEPRFLWTWPNAKIAVMGAEPAAAVTLALHQNKISNPEELQILKQKIINQYEYQSTAYYATARLWDDGIIDPINTRNVIGWSLAIFANAGAIADTNFGIFRI